MSILDLWGFVGLLWFLDADNQCVAALGRNSHGARTNDEPEEQQHGEAEDCKQEESG